jgi:predicted MFS family arabinose efflux permease
LRQPWLLAGLLVTTGILCNSYTCFTYATVILRPAYSADWVIILIMFGYGAASMLGNAVAGRLTDRFSALRVLTVVLTGLLLNAVAGAIAFASAPLGALAVLGLVWFLTAGIGNGGAGVPQQARLAALAPESAAIVMALNGSAIALGCALGGALGGAALAAGAPAYGLLSLAAVILAITVILHVAVARVRRPDAVPETN